MLLKKAHKLKLLFENKKQNKTKQKKQKKQNKTKKNKFKTSKVPWFLHCNISAYVTWQPVFTPINL